MSVDIEETRVEGLYKIKSPVHGDSRGSLREIHGQEGLCEAGLAISFDRSFYSRSGEEVLRGLHMQKEPYSQTKLVSCLAGSVYDVAVDLRPSSSTFGEVFETHLSHSEGISLLIPKGFAHGFLSLEEGSIIHYLSDNQYAPEYETGIHWRDEMLSIDWPVTNPIVSEKDDSLGSFEAFRKQGLASADGVADSDDITSAERGDTGYRVPYARSRYGRLERKRVNSVLDNPTSLARGSYTKEFERRVSDLFGKEYGVMVNSGSSANELAVELLDLPQGSVVLTPILTFSTTVAPLVRAGLIPKFVDVQSSDFQIDVYSIEKHITKDVEALLVPSLVGLLPDYEKLSKLAEKNNIKIIEDSADTIGARWKGKKTGQYTDLTTTSFYASHVITGFGGGGMVCMDDRDLYKRALKLRGWGRRSEASEGKTLDERLNSQIGDFEYDEKFVFDEVGYNFMPIEASAAFGTAQLDRLEKFTDQRLHNFKTLSGAIGDLRWLHAPVLAEEADTCPLAFPITVSEEAPFKRKELVSHLEVEGIQTRSLWSGKIVEHPGFRDIPCQLPDEPYPNATHAMRNSFVIGCHQGIGDSELEYVISEINNFMEEYE